MLMIRTNIIPWYAVTVLYPYQLEWADSKIWNICTCAHTYTHINMHLLRALTERRLGVIPGCGILASCIHLSAPLFPGPPFALKPLAFLSSLAADAFKKSRKADVFKGHAQERHGAHRPCLILGRTKGVNTRIECTHICPHCVAAFATMLRFLKSRLQVWQFTSVQSRNEWLDMPMAQMAMEWELESEAAKIYRSFQNVYEFLCTLWTHTRTQQKLMVHSRGALQPRL